MRKRNLFLQAPTGSRLFCPLAGTLGGMERARRCPRAFITPQPLPSAISSPGHSPSSWWLGSVAISFLLLVLVPVLGKQPALPQPPALPRPWQSPEQGCLGTRAWDIAGAWLGLGTAWLQKKEGC